MMRTTRWVLAAALLALFVTPMEAQDNFEVVGTYNGSYGPYIAEVDPSSFPNPGALPGNNRIDVYCVDYLHRIGIPEAWEVRYTQLSDASGIGTRTMWGQFGGFLPHPDEVQMRYTQAAWLASQFSKSETSEWKGIHYAMWHVFNGSVPSGDVSQLKDLDGNIVRYGSQYWLNEAQKGSNYGTVNMDYWYVITDKAVKTAYQDDGGQEYLTYVTPEPATIFLMGTGLVAVLGMTFVTRRSLG
jgi:hypothetical protein